MHGIDTTKVISIERILPAGAGRSPLSDRLLQQVHNRIEDIDHRHVQPHTGGFQFAAECPIHER